jgi:Tol biopolymer transport system component
MSSSERYERRLPELLDELAAPRTPAYFDDILGQVGRTRQRPGWTFPERWLPMSAVSERLSAAPRVPLRAAVVAALLLIALAIGLALLVGSRKTAVPAPFGPADNGLIAFVDQDGAIRAGLATATAFDVIVPGPGNDRPMFSPDGTRLAYLHENSRRNQDIVVAAPDGNGAVTVNADTIVSVDYLGWTPDSASVLVGRAQGKLVAFDATRRGASTVVSDTYSRGSTGFGDPIASLFRPPLGEEVAFLGSGPEGDGLYATRRDGSGTRPLLTPKTGGLPFVSLDSPEWSPDGSRIAITVLPPGVPEYAETVYVMNADGSGLRQLSDNDRPGWDRSENFGAWSPDGRRIALMRWYQDADTDEPQPLTVVDVDTGVEHQIGDAEANGFIGWSWSPDSTSIIEVASPPVADHNQVLIVNVTTGAVRRTGGTTESAPTWQRKAPAAP